MKEIFKKQLLLFILIFIGNQYNVFAETFEDFSRKILAITEIKKLEHEKSIEKKSYKKTKNKKHLYNSKFIDYIIEYQKGENGKSISYLNFIIIDYKLKDKNQLIWVNYYMENTLRKMNALTVAKKYALNAIKLSKKEECPNVLEYVYEDLGLIHYNQGQIQKAIEAFNMSYQLTKNNPVMQNFAFARINDLGVCYKSMGNYNKALYYYNLVYKILSAKKNKTFKDERLIVLLEGNIGAIFSDLKQYDKATKLLEKEINFYQKHPEFLDIGAARTIIGLIQIYEIKRDIKNLNRHIYNLVTLEKECKNDELTLFVNQFFHKYYQRNKNLSKANEISNHLLKLNEEAEARTIEKLSLLSDMIYSQKIVQYKENKRHNSKQLKHAIEEKKFSQFVSVIIILFFIVVIIFAVLFYRTMRKNLAKNIIIEKQNFQIVESINYSKKIQDALLPSIVDMKKSFKNIFVFNKPKDIVSGDFYWHKRTDTLSIIACVDCTGHGVPGAFMSTIGSMVMDKVTTATFTDPSEILTALSTEVIRILSQQTDGNIQDGMDLSVCIIDHSNNQVSYSGARNGIIIVKDEKAIRYKADLLPVGGSYSKKGVEIKRQFTSQIIDVHPNDWLYMYTDGFIEQIGGNSNLPMNYKEFENVLIELSKEENDSNRTQFLNSKLKIWRGENELSDDILIMGIQLI
jgi:serine phosphatase RsbU (regulator of sigma subunit)